MTDPKDFDYCLPKELIAQFPLQERDKSKLFVVRRKDGKLTDDIFKNISDYLEQGDVLVLNDAKVIPVRLHCKKETGGKIEIFLLRKTDEKRWKSLVRGKTKTGQKFTLEDISGEITGRNTDGSFTVEFSTDNDEKIFKYGKTPLPPYIKRPSEESDKEYYQTVYASKPGAVAAPTAGLHFTGTLLEDLKKNGVNIVFLTLYIGWASFRLFKDKSPDTESVPEEYFEITEETAAAINRAKDAGRKIVAVGTSSVRALESSVTNNKLVPFSGYTEIFIKPGFKFQIVDSLITNFHLPGSTHLYLVCAFAGTDIIKKAYNTAVEKKYRFYSYGDAMLIL